MRYDIFISYKRKSLPTANNLYYRLTTKGYSTFFDLEEMRRNNFDTQLLRYIENANDVFVILEEGSLDGCKKANWKENDWFCHEIAFALEKGKNIIPILLNGYVMPEQHELPDELKELPLKNAPEFSFSYIDEYIEKLISKEYITSKAILKNVATSIFKFYSNQNCHVYKEGKVVCSLEGNSDEPFYLPVVRKGNYRFKCINAVTNEEQLEKVTIDTNEEKEIEIEWEDRTILTEINPQQPKNDNNNLIPQKVDYATIDNKTLLSLALSKDIEACKEIAFRYYTGSKGMKKNISLANNFLKKVDFPLYPIDNELPKSLCFKFKQKKIIMVLSPNKKYYLGNVKADNDDFNWLDEKWIGVGGAAAIAAGAVFMGFVSIPIAVAVLLKSIGGLFSDSDTKNSLTNQDVIVDKEFFLQLSKETNYKFDLPSESELNGIDESMKNYCFVLRLKDNPNFMQM